MVTSPSGLPRTGISGSNRTSSTDGYDCAGADQASAATAEPTTVVLSRSLLFNILLLLGQSFWESSSETRDCSSSREISPRCAYLRTPSAPTNRVAGIPGVP